LQFSANNYLGLANHPRLNIAAKEAIDNYGFGMATERKGTGTLEIHKELEAKVS
jgi:glycine C-acetyltransferase|tara:strand:+ start:323 stop:484 length:162 start_codon:yes stop_codon:yes gene_type:complete